jgi:hypothetical protein
MRLFCCPSIRSTCAPRRCARALRGCARAPIRCTRASAAWRHASAACSRRIRRMDARNVPVRTVHVPDDYTHPADRRVHAPDASGASVGCGNARIGCARASLPLRSWIELRARGHRFPAPFEVFGGIAHRADATVHPAHAMSHRRRWRAHLPGTPRNLAVPVMNIRRLPSKSIASPPRCAPGAACW